MSKAPVYPLPTGPLSYNKVPAETGSAKSVLATATKVSKVNRAFMRTSSRVVYLDFCLARPLARTARRVRRPRAIASLYSRGGRVKSLHVQYPAPHSAPALRAVGEKHVRPGS